MTTGELKPYETWQTKWKGAEEAYIDEVTGALIVQPEVAEEVLGYLSPDSNQNAAQINDVLDSHCIFRDGDQVETNGNKYGNSTRAYAIDENQAISGGCPSCYLNNVGFPTQKPDGSTKIVKCLGAQQKAIGTEGLLIIPSAYEEP